MSSVPWFAWYAGDYRAKTHRLSFVEDAAYRRLLDEYYLMAEALPVALPELYRICGAQSDDERRAVDSVVERFFYVKNNELHNKRADHELTKQARLRENLSERGKAGAQARWNATANATGNATGYAKPMAEHMAYPQPQPQPHLQATTTSTNNKPRKVARKTNGHDFQLPTDIDPQLWDDFIEMRRRIRKPATNRAKWLIVGKLGNLEKQGHNTVKVLQQSIRNGWQDVFPLRGDK